MSWASDIDYLIDMDQCWDDKPCKYETEGCWVDHDENEATAAFIRKREGDDFVIAWTNSCQYTENPNRVGQRDVVLVERPA